MKIKQKGVFWHVHHDVLMEYCYNYQERVDCIKNNKPREEIKTRLKLFKPVKGKLPSEYVEACEVYSKAGKAFDKADEALDKANEALDKANEAYDKANEALDKARKAYDKANEALDKAGKALDKARKAYDKANEAYDKANEALNKARKALDKARAANMPAILKLHEKECGCKWSRSGGITKQFN